jgi:hypothetical protein
MLMGKGITAVSTVKDKDLTPYTLHGFHLRAPCHPSLGFQVNQRRFNAGIISGDREEQHSFSLPAG